MKNLLITLGLVFSTISIYAQDTIVCSNVQNVDMMIANIFGIQCDGVSNLQVLSNPMAMGRFEKGNSIGVNSGIMMSTGVIYDVGNNSGQFNSANLNMPGDVDIDFFGLEQGINYPSYDASVIEFDFTPSITDTIRFTYVFASEEYPEYVNQNYTDRFLFLISKNGGAYKNIARLPISDTTVEINTVNQYVNSLYYNDNLSGPNMPYFSFDGYTVPLEAKFFAEVDSTYHIKLVISDISDGLYDSAIFLEEQESNNDISGTLSVNGLPAQGTLEVFNFVQGDTLLATPIESVDVIAGGYLADSLPTGMYHVRFTPDPVVHPGAAPMYFVNSQTWESAQVIGLPCYLEEGDINSDELINPNGGSNIFGTIGIDSSYLKSVITPFEGALVKLFDDSDNLIAFTYSNATGDFGFGNLNAGSYYIKLDVPYIPQTDVHDIELTTDESIQGVDFNITNKLIQPIDNMVAGINEGVLNNEISVYPNPVQDQLNVKTNQNSTYSITNINGTKVQSGNLNYGTNAIDFNQITPGIYFLEVNGQIIEKIVKNN